MAKSIDESRWIPFDSEGAGGLAVPAANAVGLTAAKITFMAANENNYIAKVLVQDFPIAWQEIGTTATGTDKNIANVGDSFVLQSLLAMKNFSAIGVGGTAHLAVTYYKEA